MVIKMKKDRKKGSGRIAAGVLLLAALFIAFPAQARGALIGNAEGSISAPGAGMAPRITINGEAAYSMFPHTSLPNQTPFRQAEEYEDAGMESLLYAGYPFDGFGLQKKYGVSDDFAHVVTQWAIWYYVEGWPSDFPEDSVRAQYLTELLEAAHTHKPQEHPVAVEPKAPAFQHQSGYYRSEALTLRQADGVITVQQPTDGVQILLEDGTAATTLRQGDRFFLLAPDHLEEIALQVSHQFSTVTPVRYIPETADERMDHLLRAQEQEQTRSGVWRFALPEEAPSGTQEPTPTVSENVTKPPAPSASVTAEPETMPQTGSPSTGGVGMPATAATLLGLCWVVAGVAFLEKRSRNGGQ